MTKTNYSVVIIEDSEVDMASYRRFLTADNENEYRFIEAYNGVSGIALCLKENPDCILLDYNLPDMTGLEVLQKLALNFNVLPILILTGQGDTVLAVNAMKAGAQGYLSKDRMTADILKKEVINTVERAQLIRKVSQQTEDLRQTNENLQKANADAKSSSKAKDEFLANMSHEIRTPMNGIIGVTELLFNSDLTKKQEKYVHSIYTSGEILLDLINDILDFSKIEADEVHLHLVATSLQNTLMDVMEILKPKAVENNTNLSHICSDNVPAIVTADPCRIRQIIINLTNNALKFTRNGNVKIGIQQLERSDTDCKLRFEIKDDGIGIPKEMQQYIFEKFTQVDSSSTRQYGGTGLGLSICKRLVKLMGGNIGVSSETGKGSLFWFEITLPVAYTDISLNHRNITNLIASDKPGIRVRPSEGYPQFNARILVAEDVLSNQYVMQEILEHMGCTVTISIDGNTTIKTLEEKNGQYDLILMDCQMPGIDGYEVTKIIRSKPWGHNLPIVAITAHALVGDRERCLAIGMNDYVSKPVRFMEIEAILAKYVKKNSLSL
jgi:signal transduction histidine kinase